VNLAIFASGGGSNARKIIEHFQNHPSVKIALVVTNRADAGVLGIAEEHAIPSVIISKSILYDESQMIDVLEKHEIGFIVLAGFLLLMPSYLTEKFDRRMVNIHPALLPKYGGKGMYGHHVHEAVKAAREMESGMTIHFCNAHYDEGGVIFQARCSLSPDDSAEDIARKVLVLEHTYYPAIIEKVVLGSI
jgi:phosphoribosylglycinamide formyltransferase 1